MNFKKLALSAAVVSVFACGSALAAESNANLTVSATLTSACTVAAGTIGFGNIVALATTTAADATGTLDVACSNGSTPTVYSPTARTMSGSGSAATGSISFNLSQADGAAANDLPTDALGAEAMTGFTADGAVHAVSFYALPTGAFTTQPVGPYSVALNVVVKYN